jgi:hypothetical protein
MRAGYMPINVGTTSTWVKTDRRAKTDNRDGPADNAQFPQIITMAQLGVASGDILQAYSTGDYKPCSYDPNPACRDKYPGMLGAFVGKGGKLVPYGEGGTVTEVKTDPTCRYYYSGGHNPLDSNVPNDFVLSTRQDAPSILVVPKDAVGLVFSTYDCYFIDNSDPDGDFQVHLALLPRIIEVVETKYSIEDRNRYSENVDLTARVIFPVGHPKAGQTDTSFEDVLDFEENGTDYYNGTNGSTKLPFKKAKKGVLKITVKSTSTVGVAIITKPMPAQISVSAPDHPNSILEGTLTVEQWRDADSNQMIDWLDHSTRDILKCAKQKGGELKEMTEAVMRIRQATPAEVKNECGNVEDSDGATHVVAISPYCSKKPVSSNDPHRLNEGRELSTSVLHELRHAWQFRQRNRSDASIVDDDGKAKTPRNDDDEDYYLERISRASAMKLLESYYKGHTEKLADTPFATDSKDNKYEQDAEAFGQRFKGKCP